MSQALSILAQTDINRALAYASQIEGSARSEVLGSLGMAYMHLDPENAMQWVIEQKDNHATTMAFNMLASINLPLTESYMSQLADQSFSGQLLRNITSEKAQIDMKSAMLWLDGYKEHEGYQNAFVHAISAHHNPEVVSSYLDPHADDAKFSNAFKNVASSWGHRNPQQAADWAIALPEGDNRTHAIAAVAQSNSTRSPDLALELLSELPDDQSDQIRIQIAFGRIQRQDNIDEVINELDLTPEQAEQLRNYQQNSGIGFINVVSPSRGG